MIQMSILLEQARRELDAARSDVFTAATTYKAAVATAKDAQARVRKLEMAQIDADLLMHQLERRAAEGRS